MLACFILDVHPSMGRRSSPCSPSSSPSGEQQQQHPSAATKNLRGAGLSSLEWAKAAVEHFIKQRQRAGRADQYFLLTTEEGAGCVRAAWGDSPQRFDDQLRLLAPLPSGPGAPATKVGDAISAAFALMNQYRLQRGTDNYGQGRCPWVIEPGCCLLFTDGESMKGGDGGGSSPQQLKLTCPANDLTHDPYRWDQRFFPLVIQPGAGASAGGPQQAPLVPLRNLADATGGFYSSTDSLMGLNVRVDHILHKLDRTGPVVMFAPADATDQPQPPPLPAPPQPEAQPQSEQQHQDAQGQPLPAAQADGGGGQPQQASGTGAAGDKQAVAEAKPAAQLLAAVRAVLMLTSESAGNMWPIPEAYWLERAMEHLPKRDAQPTLLYRRLPPDSHDPALTGIALLEQHGLAMDRYVLDWCSVGGGPLGGGGGGGAHAPQNPLAKMGRDARWPVYLQDSRSRPPGRGEPIGFLEAADLAGRVTLVLLPYNYPRLAELVRQATEKGSALGNLTGLPVKWRPEFNAYLSQTPPYYYTSLRRCLKRVGLHTQVPEAKGGGLSQTVVKRLQRLRDQAREENQRYEQSRNEHPRYNPELQLQQHMYMGVPDASAAVGVTDGGGMGPGAHASGAGAGLGGGTSELLGQWEAARRRLFGQQGHALSGLYVKGLKSWRGVCGGKAARRKDMTLLGQVGAQQVPENPIVEMGAYTETLLRAELLRDPLAEPDPEEDTPEGLLQRKLQVNFGNPFRNIHGPGGMVLPAGGAGAGGAAGGGHGGPCTAPHVMSAEAEDEAAVLGPHSALGDDLGGEEAGGSPSPVVAAEAPEAAAEGGATAVTADSTTLDEQGQPARKRQRLNELPPLPTAKKLKRQHHPKQRLSAPAGSGSDRSKSPPATPTTPSSQPAGESALSGKGGKGKEPHAEGATTGPASAGEKRPRAAEKEPAAATAAAGAAGPAAAGGGQRAKEAASPHPARDGAGVHTTAATSTDGVSAAPAVKPKPKLKPTAAVRDGAGAAAGGQSAAAPAPKAAAQPQQQQQHQPPPQLQQGHYPSLAVRPIEELLKDPSLQTPNEDGWMLAFSKREKRPYYFNTKTNVSVWQAPPGLPPINVDTPAAAGGGSGSGGGGASGGGGKAAAARGGGGGGGGGGAGRGCMTGLRDLAS